MTSEFGFICLTNVSTQSAGTQFTLLTKYRPSAKVGSHWTARNLLINVCCKLPTTPPPSHHHHQSIWSYFLHASSQQARENLECLWFRTVHFVKHFSALVAFFHINNTGRGGGCSKFTEHGNRSPYGIVICNLFFTGRSPPRALHFSACTCPPHADGEPVVNILRCDWVTLIRMSIVASSFGVPTLHFIWNIPRDGHQHPVRQWNALRESVSFAAPQRMTLNNSLWVLFIMDVWRSWHKWIIEAWWRRDWAH